MPQKFNCWTELLEFGDYKGVSLERLIVLSPNTVLDYVEDGLIVCPKFHKQVVDQCYLQLEEYLVNDYLGGKR